MACGPEGHFGPAGQLVPRTPEQAPDLPCPAPTFKPFLRDQVEAASVLREENAGEDAKARHERRLDAVHAALRYIDTCGAGRSYSPADVITLARQFETYFQEP